MRALLGALAVEASHDKPEFTAPPSAITAAVVGVIANLAVWFAAHFLFRRQTRIDDWGLDLLLPVADSVSLPAVALSTVALLLTFVARLSVPLVLAICAALGVALQLLGITPAG